MRCLQRSRPAVPAARADTLSDGVFGAVKSAEKGLIRPVPSPMCRGDAKNRILKLAVSKINTIFVC